MNIWNIIKLHVSSRWFLDAEVRHHWKLKQEREAYADPEEDKILPRIKKKRRGIYVSLFFTTLSIGAGLLFAVLLSQCYSFTVETLRWLRLGSLGIVAWAVLARLGYETTTVGGETLLETTSEDSFKFFYLVAVFLTTLTLSLVPA